MKHSLIKRVLAAAVVFCCLSVTTSYAETTQDDIEHTKSQITDLQNKKEDAESDVTEYQGEKERWETELGSLDAQLSDLTGSMNELEEEIKKKQEEIERKEEQLEESEADIQRQYEDMKLRIQFMYENGGISGWQTLLEAESFSEFLNRTEYIAKINNYDRKMLVQFQESKEKAEQQKAELENRMTELLAVMDEKKQRQSDVNKLIGSAQNKIAASEEKLAGAQSDVSELENKINEMIKLEQELEIKKAKEDAARLEAIKAQEKEDTSNVVYVPADSDAYLLGAIIQCEADGEPYEGKLAVGSVILNRVKSSHFPGTVSGVIYQNGQFSPVASGRLAYRLEAGVNGTCLGAAQEVLNGTITTDCFYFRANNGYIEGAVIGNHVFY